MKLRLYCMFDGAQALTRSHASPCREAHVHLMSKKGLCAAFSEVSDVAGERDSSALIRHHKVIESFFEQVTVVPFRFQSVMEDVRDLELLLETRGDYYKQVLRRLDGCAEMGIRVMVHDRPAAHAADSPTGESSSPECSNPGMLYLLRRKDRYSAESLRAEQQERISEEFRTEFAGMFKEFTSEASKPTIQGSDAGAFLVSLYFLVP
ncbi:MAG: GvpL/GvpF family gas vesicle protein, partial [Desulfomonilaceae bacterium]|nr:GvpL/GvpF family gas vesicle protein [Desulfomonilaceae bacterium]